MEENQSQKQNQKKKSSYRPRQQVIADCVASGAMTESEAEVMNRSIAKGDKYIQQGKMFIDLKPYNEILTENFKRKVEKGELSEKQQKTLHLMRVANVSKPNINIPNEVKLACEEYIKITIEDNVGCTINGLSLALGFSIADLRKIASGETKSNVKDIISTYIQMIATNTEMTIANGGAVGAMFIGKNYFNMQDKTEVVHTEKKEVLTDEELADKYKNIDVIDVDSEDK